MNAVVGFTLNGGELAVLMAVALVFVEAVCRIGDGVAPSFSQPRHGALERFGVGTLLGFCLLGMAFLGLALTGIYYPAVVLGCAFLLLAGSGAARPGMPLVVKAVWESRKVGAPGLAAVALAALPAIQRGFMPEMDQSGYIYHLGAPWSFLNAHRILLSHVPWAFHVPLTMEMTYAIPLVLGDERLAKWEVMACFCAVSAVFAGRCLGEGRRVSAWMGPFLALSSGYVMWLLGSSKSDMAAASLFVAGALLTRNGSWKLGCILLGFCGASKLTYVPMVAVWLAVIRPPWKLYGWTAASLTLPLLPWLSKSWLATGNPVYPLASSVLHAYDWGPLNDAAGMMNIHNITLTGYRYSVLPGLWFRNMGKEFLVPLLLIPGLLMAGRHRRTAVACLVGQAVTFLIRPDIRYLLPSVCYLAFLAAEELEYGRDRFRQNIFRLFAGYGLLHAVAMAGTCLPEWRGIFTPDGEMARRYFPYQESLMRRLGEMGYRRVVSVGEIRTYAFPCRLLHGGTEGETPLIWKLVKESRDQRELGKRFVQLGTEYLVYNYVTVEWFAEAYHVFPWDRRMMRLYVDFCRSCQTEVYRSESCDFDHGGYYIYRILRRPLASPPPVTWFAPGMEPVIGTALSLQLKGRRQESLELLLETLKLVPDVGMVWNAIGHAYADMADPVNAFKYLRKFAELGMMDCYNLPDYGGVAIQVMKLDLAERVLQESLRRYPAQSPAICANLALLRVLRASAAVARRQFGEAEGLLVEGEGYLDRVPVNWRKAGFRLGVRAKILALRGQILLIRGENVGGANLLREAFRVNPDDPLASVWKKAADQADPAR